MTATAAARLRLMLNGDRGEAVPLVLLAPTIALIIGFLIFAGRVSLAGNAVSAAATAAARDASLARSAGGAVAAAQEAAARSLAQSGTKCTHMASEVDASGLDVPLGQIGTVSVAVRCTANLSDIGLPLIPGTKELTARASSPVDAYRQR